MKDVKIKIQFGIITFMVIVLVSFMCFPSILFAEVPGYTQVTQTVRKIEIDKNNILHPNPGKTLAEAKIYAQQRKRRSIKPDTPFYPNFQIVDNNTNLIHSITPNIRLEFLDDFQVGKIGDELSAPAIAGDEDGGFVICWEKNYNQGIFAQRYNSEGEAQGPTFRVSDYIESVVQQLPGVGMDEDGNFIICWEDFRNEEPISDVYAQRYNSEGVALGSNFKVASSNSYSLQTHPAIAVAEDGSFIISWKDWADWYPDVLVSYQRYSSDGIPIGVSHNARDYYDYEEGGTLNGFIPAIDIDNQGNFTICWRDDRFSDSDVYAQNFNSAGTRLGSNYIVSDDEGSARNYTPDISFDGSGNFVICWRDNRDNSNIFAQYYDENRIAVGNNFQVSENTSDFSCCHPAITMDGSSNFIITWSEVLSDESDIYVRYFNSDRDPINDCFKVNNDYANSKQILPDLAYCNNHIYFAWADDRSPGMNWNVFAKIIDYNIPTSILLTSPNGGEIWHVGTHHHIRWESDYYTGKVKVEISTTGGQSWWDVTNHQYTSNDGHYGYTYPMFFHPPNSYIYREREREGERERERARERE